ncbi:MAG: hypothetical protein NTU79_25105 [Planctomycetota bacterium]|nr:hypothetical protein [Planctomycetota bacterium]
MKREEIQTLLKKGLVATSSTHVSPRSSRPVTLVVAFLTISCLAALFLSELVGVSSLGARWSRTMVADFRFNLHIAIVFWLCFRGGKWFSSEMIIPLLCLCGSLALDSIFNRWFLVDPLVLVWGQVYRLLLISLVFRIFRRAFRISLQPIQRSTKCPAVEKLGPMSRGRISMEELVFLQFLQLGIVWGVALLFVWTGYRFCFNKPERNPMDSQGVKFDAIE